MDQKKENKCTFFQMWDKNNFSFFQRSKQTGSFLAFLSKRWSVVRKEFCLLKNGSYEDLIDTFNLQTNSSWCNLQVWRFSIQCLILFMISHHKVIGNWWVALLIELQNWLRSIKNNSFELATSYKLNQFANRIVVVSMSHYKECRLVGRINGKLVQTHSEKPVKQMMPPLISSKFSLF